MTSSVYLEKVCLDGDGRAVAQERKQNSWRGARICDSPSNGTEQTTHLGEETTALGKMIQSPVTEIRGCKNFCKARRVTILDFAGHVLPVETLEWTIC